MVADANINNGFIFLGILTSYIISFMIFKTLIIGSSNVWTSSTNTKSGYLFIGCEYFILNMSVVINVSLL